MGLVIRPAVPADVATMQAIEVSAGELFREIGLTAIADDPPPTDEALLAHIADGTAWVAELDHVVAGYAVASVVDGEGHLDQVSVRPSAGRRGVGQALMERVVGWAMQAGRPALTLTTFTEVPWNGPYYERLGFHPIPFDACGPELRAIRAAETAAGLDVAPRTAMRRPL